MLAQSLESLTDMQDHPNEFPDSNEFQHSRDSESDLPEPITKFLEIPKILHSVQKDAPFETCISCGANLLTSSKLYVIEKVIRRNEVIIELAMCLSCRSEQSDDGMSETSAKTIQQFLNDKINFEQRLGMMAQVNQSDSIDPWLERCLLSDQPAQMFSEYQVVALCKGPWIQRDFYPALISGTAAEELSDMLSKETRDWMDDFVGENFGMPSEFCEPPTFSPVLM